MDIRVRSLGIQDYQTTFDAMREFTARRNSQTESEIWLLEHHPVFTQGQAGKPEHVINPGDIPLVQSDRGGQVTYHGPGQLIAYLLLDLKKAGLGVRGLVTAMENAVIALLDDFDIGAEARGDAPGVYVDNRKVASLGLRIRKGFSYHGLALNVDMDLEPFSRINPCGYAGLEVTQLKTLGVPLTLEQTGERITNKLCAELDAHCTR
ncbi:MAG: lipoyl(octanoyl) transferase LipB [bacterium]